MKMAWIGVALLASILSCMALDSSDLLFHLSFENGVAPELARGSAAPVTPPTELDRRLVDGGLFGKGYLFAGKGSGINYATGAKPGPAACDEMYTTPANFFGDYGTVAFWIKPLTNLHECLPDMVHYLFLCNGPGAFQIMKVGGDGVGSAWSFYYAGAGGGFTDGTYKDEWLHFAVTFMKGRTLSYMNGRLTANVSNAGVLAPTPERFLIASEINLGQAIQKKVSDDAIMDEFQIFRRPLSEEEVYSLFERGHATVVQPAGYGDTIQPQRAYEPALLAAPRPSAPITVDGNLSEWQGLPAHGGLIERRIGVLDSDDARLWVAADDQNLYLAFRTEVDKELQADPTHVKYPTGQYKAGASRRDGDVYADDYVEWMLKGKDGHTYRFVVNAKDALLDSRDGDKGWNANAAFKSRSDFSDWTAELAVPLADLGMKAGESVEFNVVRSWKLFKSSQNALCIDERSQPFPGKLLIASPAAAAVSGLGSPDQGNVRMTGAILGTAGEYTVRLTGKGHNQSFTNEQKVAVGQGLKSFEVARKMEKPGDAGLIVQVLNPAGQPVFTRTVPIVYAPLSTVELTKYPSWNKLDVTVQPVGADLKSLRAEVAMERDGKAVLTQAIASFDDPLKTVRFETARLSTGTYDVVTRIIRGATPASENRQVFEKKPLPEWFDSKAGIIDHPPVPWTDVKVEKEWLMFNGLWGKRKAADGANAAQGRKTKVMCLLKEITFQQTLFPAEILSNEQDLLSGPIRLRIKRGGKEKVVAAGDFRITEQTPRRVTWQSTAQDGDLAITVDGWIEFDGFTWVNITLAGLASSATISSAVDRVTIEIPLRKQCATLKNIGSPLQDGKPVDLPTQYGSYWFGNEKAGLQYYWQSNKGWVLAGELGKMIATNDEVILSIPFIQKTVDLAKARTVALGWAITPSKPVRRNWRYVALHRGISYAYADYAALSPNYAVPHEKKETYDLWRHRQEKETEQWPITCYYAFGPFMWVGSPEYAEWWHEWRPIPSGVVRPDPNSTSWGGPACHNSSATELQLHLLDKYVKNYPQQGIYFDCMGPIGCGNEAHGCGYVDDNGVRQPESQLLADRRYYERIYNVIKATDPRYAWVRHHDWVPNMPTAAFCDDNWLGEGFCGAIQSDPKHNYHDILPLPAFRMMYGKEHWGHLTSWLTETAVYAGDRETRAEVYGKMVSPPKDGRHGEWILPKWKDYEHVAGLAIIHDIEQVGGNDLPVPAWIVYEIERLMGWDDFVQFTGYWETGDRLKIEGGVPEKIVGSLYHRPAGAPPPVVITNSAAYNPSAAFSTFYTTNNCRAKLKAAGANAKGWLILTPMNNTDEDVTLTLRPDLKAFGLSSLAGGQLRDIYRDYEGGWQPNGGWRANESDPEAPYLVFKPEGNVFPMTNGTATVTIPKRNFRMLLVEPRP